MRQDVTRQTTIQSGTDPHGRSESAALSLLRREPIITSLPLHLLRSGPDEHRDLCSTVAAVVEAAAATAAAAVITPPQQQQQQQNRAEAAKLVESGQWNFSWDVWESKAVNLEN